MYHKIVAIVATEVEWTGKVTSDFALQRGIEVKHAFGAIRLTARRDTAQFSHTPIDELRRPDEHLWEVRMRWMPFGVSSSTHPMHRLVEALLILESVNKPELVLLVAADNLEALIIACDEAGYEFEQHQAGGVITTI